MYKDEMLELLQNLDTKACIRLIDRNIPMKHDTRKLLPLIEDYIITPGNRDLKVIGWHTVDRIKEYERKIDRIELLDLLEDVDLSSSFMEVLVKPENNEFYEKVI